MWGWIIGAAAVLGAGYVLVTMPIGGGAQGPSKGAGWYVLLYDRLGEATGEKMPDGTAARLKEYRGVFDTKAQADAAAREARAEGWTGKDARALVEYRDRSPW